MPSRLLSLLTPLLALLLGLLAPVARAQQLAAPTLTPTHVFGPTAPHANGGGAGPRSSLLALGDGYLYGTAVSGGTGGAGAVFRLHTDGTGFADVHDFAARNSAGANADGAQPLAALISLGDGYLYGTTSEGGAGEAGTVFRLHADGTGFTVLHAFSAPTNNVNADGSTPYGALVAGGDGFLYGTAYTGGAGGTGGVFRLRADGTGFSDLHDFAAVTSYNAPNAGGARPTAGLVAGGDGYLYGTASVGGAGGTGAVFRLHLDGTGFSDLHDFAAATGYNAPNADGADPTAALIAPGDGFLYGTAQSGGTSGAGTVFRLGADGTGFATLHAFSALPIGVRSTNADGAHPATALLASGTTLYGTAYAGGANGSGDVFRLGTDGSGFADLHDFAALSGSTNGGGANPYAALIAPGDGFLYGTANAGGANGQGQVYRVGTDGTGYQSLYDFAAVTPFAINADGAGPEAALIAGGDGFLYGTTAAGGAAGTGTVFKVRPDGTGFTVLYAFSVTSGSPAYANADGAFPAAALLAGGDGYVYGTASGGGTMNGGTVFRVATGGSGFEVLYDFGASDDAGGANPSAALISLGDGYLYGTAESGGANDRGTVFRLRPDGTGFQDLYDFSATDGNTENADGAYPAAALAAPGDGFLYGTASGGGTTDGGTVFRVATDGTGFTVLHDFSATDSSGDNADGVFPAAALLSLGDGYVYGTAEDGGASGEGTVFRLKTDGSGFQDLHDFSATDSSGDNADGALPLAGLVAGGDGLLYGTAENGGASGVGTVFRLSPDGTTLPLQTFYALTPDTDGSSPQASLLVFGDGFLYGTTYGSASGSGTVFRLTGPPVSHVLWDNPDGKTIFWDVSADGSHTVAGTYGPYADNADPRSAYTARSLSTGPDGVSHLLWNSPAGNTYLWTVQADGSFTPYFYGLFEDDGTANTIWQPVAVSTGGDNVTHVLWTNPDGRTILWDVSPTDGAFTVVGNYDPHPGYVPAALATGPDGLSHVLWNGPNGQTLLWDLDANNQPTAHAYGPFSDDGTANTLWQARAVSVGPDGVPHLLWTNPDGRTILWNVNADGTFAITGNYGPFQDDASGNTSYTAVALATGADGLSHFAWDNPDGNSYLWSVQPNGGFTPTFYPPFYDGPNVWKAVAVSAAVPPAP